MKWRSGYSIHHALPKSSTDPQVTSARTCAHCMCARAPSFPDIILSDSVLSLSHPLDKNPTQVISSLLTPALKHLNTTGDSVSYFKCITYLIAPFSATRQSRYISYLPLSKTIVSLLLHFIDLYHLHPPQPLEPSFYTHLSSPAPLQQSIYHTRLNDLLKTSQILSFLCLKSSQDFLFN